MLIYCFLFLTEIALVRTFSTRGYLLPQLTLLFVTVYATKHSLKETLWMSFFCGFVHEIISPQFFGTYIWSFVLSGLFIFMVTRKWTDQEASFPMVIWIIGSATLLFHVWVYIYDLMLALFGLLSLPAFGKLFFSRLIWIYLTNILLFYPIRFVFRLIPHEKPFQV